MRGVEILFEMSPKLRVHHSIEVVENGDSVVHERA